MSFKIQELREVNDDVLIVMHDELAMHTLPGVDYYLEELRRRDQARAMAESHRLAIEGHRLANRTFWLSVVNGVLAIVAVLIALFG